MPDANATASGGWEPGRLGLGGTDGVGGLGGLGFADFGPGREGIAGRAGPREAPGPWAQLVKNGNN